MTDDCSPSAHINATGIQLLNCSPDRSSLSFQARCAQRHLASTHGKISTRNMSHQENGREISESDVLGNVQAQKDGKGDKRLQSSNGRAGKQPLRENRDQHPEERNTMQQGKGRTTTPPAASGPAPRKKPAELATDAVQEFCEAEDDEMVEQGKKLESCASTKAKGALTKVKQEAMESDLPEEWAELFRRNRNRGASRGAIPGTAKQQQVHRNVQFPIEKPETTQRGVHKKTQFSPMKVKFAPPRGGFAKVSRGKSKQAMTCEQNTREESKQKTHERMNEKAAPAKDRTHQRWHQQPKPADQHLGPAQQLPAKRQHPGPAPGTKKTDTTAGSKKHVHKSLKSQTKVKEKCAMNKQDSCKNLSCLQESKAGRTFENLRRPDSTQPTTTLGTRSTLCVSIAKCNVNCIKKGPFCLPQDVANCSSMTVRQIRGRLECTFSLGGGKTNNNGNGGSEKMERNWGWGGDMKSLPACTRARKRRVLGDVDTEGWHRHGPAKHEGMQQLDGKRNNIREGSITWWLVKFRRRWKEHRPPSEAETLRRCLVTWGRCGAHGDLGNCAKVTCDNEWGLSQPQTASHRANRTPGLLEGLGVRAIGQTFTKKACQSINQTQLMTVCQVCTSMQPEFNFSTVHLTAACLHSKHAARNTVPRAENNEDSPVPECENKCDERGCQLLAGLSVQDQGFCLCDVHIHFGGATTPALSQVTFGLTTLLACAPQTGKPHGRQALVSRSAHKQHSQAGKGWEEGGACVQPASNKFQSWQASSLNTALLVLIGQLAEGVRAIGEAELQGKEVES
eukprot:jgi/Bigna1/75833/fgenesh1_pg.37_\